MGLGIGLPQRLFVTTIWMQGKTAHTIKFISEAEIYLSKSNPDVEIVKKLQDYIKEIKTTKIQVDLGTTLASWFAENFT